MSRFVFCCCRESDSFNYMDLFLLSDCLFAWLANKSLRRKVKAWNVTNHIFFYKLGILLLTRHIPRTHRTGKSVFGTKL